MTPCSLVGREISVFLTSLHSHILSALNTEALVMSTKLAHMYQTTRHYNRRTIIFNARADLKLPTSLITQF